MPKGFQYLTPERRKEIASLGGKAAHAKGTAHRFTTEEAREAGKKGGQKTFSQLQLRHQLTEEERLRGSRKGVIARKKL